MGKTILITGATGKQGRALVNALASRAGQSSADEASEQGAFRILALTRNASSSAAQHLAQKEHVEVVQGDLDDRESVRKVFEDAKSTGGIWGVYCALAFPGLGANADGEERQGKLMADLALEYGVSVYIYSSAERAGPAHDDEEVRSGRAKMLIERHVKSLGEKGLSWTIMRPGFFLDNYEGFIGSITVAVMKCGLKPDSKVALIDSEDIGRVAAAIFRSPDKYQHKELVVIGEVASMSEQNEAYKRATGRPLPSIPNIFARILVAINKSTKDLVDHFDALHHARVTGQHDQFESQVQLTREALPEIKSVYDWALVQKNGQGRDSGDQGWNKVSIWQLITGRL
ncbi:uncharacterized protein FIBRA_02315 [Fibroporia radiculosa]|uniref:NmrA-like domain-containing protein n=1 Tax=Fibroporia radiculosa TaxID=599839 RepID=J4GMS8_9APHY|nr:uncharacterized protein FIBRA_02315 [Fibroporia radiculosa]CCM00285.1 predicted protein [Fibroporia radiculosa]